MDENYTEENNEKCEKYVKENFDDDDGAKAQVSENNTQSMNPKCAKQLRNKGSLKVHVYDDHSGLVFSVFKSLEYNLL